MQLPAESSCISCFRLESDGFQATCKAFPKGIPEEIISGKHDHRKPFRGDKGILYKSVLEQFGITDEENSLTQTRGKNE